MTANVAERYPVEVAPSIKTLGGSVVVRVFRMGTTYGGVLSEVGLRQRHGGVSCPVCETDGFVPIRFERWVRCCSCQTVFVQRRSKQVAEVLVDATREMLDLANGRGRKH